MFSKCLIQGFYSRDRISGPCTSEGPSANSRTLIPATLYSRIGKRESGNLVNHANEFVVSFNHEFFKAGVDVGHLKILADKTRK